MQCLDNGAIITTVLPDEAEIHHQHLRAESEPELGNIPIPT
jgi:hypothetical protein